MRVAAVVLAAGASSRMGRNKMLLDLHGEPLVRRSVRAVAGECDPVVVVVGPDASDMRAALADLDVACISNPDPTSPPGRSFQLGLEALEHVDAAIMCLGDMVDLSAEMIHGVVKAGEDACVSIVLSEFGGVLAPPYLVKRELFGEARSRKPAGVVRQLAETHPQKTATVVWATEYLTDVDTPNDLEAARKRPS
jgi:molybdenum cofactor cytidylyltransferase